MNDDTTRLLEHLAETFPDQPAPLASIVGAARVVRRRRARRNAALAVAALALVAVAGVAVQQALPDGDRRSDGRVADTVPEPSCDKGDPVPAREPVPQGPDYPTNAAGQTYGSAIDNSPQPDLVAAIGDCGRTGYVSSDRFEEPPPWVPGAGSTDPRSVPVYESDGVTQIDTFTQDPGASVADGVTDPPVPAAATDGPDLADLEGRWTATIAGSSREGREAYDTYRDLDLWIGFRSGRVRVHDGCRTHETAVDVVRGAVTLAPPFGPVTVSAATGPERCAPLPEVVDNVRHITQSGGRAYLHLADFRIAVVLTPGG